MTYNRPIGKLIGKYEAGLLREGNHSRATFRWFCDAIEGFFEEHPRVKEPHQVLITDVEDWRVMRLERGDAWNVIRKDMCALHAFYNWLIKEEGLDISQPFWIPPTLKESLARVG